ncbi:serine/threonine-protein kinase [Streptomyces sp. NPDC051940]|uniref:serine/threonine-protein kinase n=1 Tax=Streptomyces sp. NPDC051940 TaxID=3155675 RepID=UPI003442CFFA
MSRISTETGSDLGALTPDDPREIAGYRLTARLGEGGMGTVYLSHTRGGQPVALKLIRREYGRDPEFRRRFEQEVRAARRVQGYHLVPVVDHDTSGELPWVASEYVPGVALEDALRSYGALPLPAVFQLVGAAARALGAIHTADVVHRDLKPSNIMLAASGPYVIDFGIARAADATKITTTGGLIGTPQYMSPEHALGDTVGPATDLFSLGLIAAVAATGRHPYGDGGGLTVATKIANTAVRPPDLSEYPGLLRPLLERCLVADPGERTGSAELSELCERYGERAPRDFAGWLPERLAADVARRARAAEVATPPATPTPTVKDGPGPQGPPPETPVHTVTAAQPPRPAPGAGFGPPLSAPHQPPSTPYQQPSPYSPASRPGRSSFRDRPVLNGFLIAVGALLCLGLLTSLWPDGDSGDGDTDRTSDGATQTPASGDTGDGATSEAPKPPPYKVLVKGQKLSMPAAHSTDNVGVDFDTPRVNTQDADYDTDEIIINSVVQRDAWDFESTFGKSAGTTPQQCENAAQTAAVATIVAGEDFAKTFPVGTVLCTVTDEGNIGMLKITKIVPSTDTYDHLPDVSGELTVWSKQ